MISKYMEQLLDVYNYIDSIFIVDKKGCIEYYKDYKSGINDFTEQEILGKHILDVYPDLTEDTSTVLKVLRTGNPIVNNHRRIRSFKGNTVEIVSNTLPIIMNDQVVGVADVSQYVGQSRQSESLKIEYKKKHKTRALFSLDDIISNSSTIALLKDNIMRVSRSDSSVLIYGETGTGKELVAQSIHTHSKRAKHQFISQNCAAIPSALLESIFFGTVKGSYTGAEHSKGIFEIANNGTIFLDEINSMDIGMQSKILKAIEEQRFKKVGGSEYIDIDVRVISALNEDPMTCIREKMLRADLFYRLSVVQFIIPPLRERKGDINLLTDYFIDQMNIKLGRNILGVNEDVERIFNEYNWRGNVRELRNVIEGCVNINDTNYIQKSNLPEYLLRPIETNIDTTFEFINDSELSLKEKMDRFEAYLISESVSASRNLSSAALQLKISRQTLNYKLNKFNIEHI